MTDELTLEKHTVVLTVTRFPSGTSDGRVTTLTMDLEPELKEEEEVGLDSDIVVDALIYALKLNYDIEKEHGRTESPEHYAKDVARILRDQIENDDPSKWHGPSPSRRLH